MQGSNLPPINVKSSLSQKIDSGEVQAKDEAKVMQIPEHTAQILAWISTEIKKLLTTTHKVTHRHLADLENTVKMECYLREKKSAIL